MPRVTEQHRQARRAQILDAARRCFLRQGFHATSMSDLREASGLSAGALYTYFAGKDDVILAIVDQNIADVLATLRDTTGAAPQSLPELFAQVAAMIELRERTDGFASLVLLVWAEATLDERLRARLSALIAEYRLAFATLARERGIAGDATSAEGIGLLMSSLVAGLVLHLAIDGEQSVRDLPAVVERWLPAVPERR